MNPMKLLVIEDDESLRNMLSEYLTIKGSQVDTAGDGITGLHLAVVNDYDALIIDLTLPGIDGLEITSKLRNEAHKATPILMLTGRGTLDDKLTGFSKGADDYLVKPFELEELFVRLHALCKRQSKSIIRQHELSVGNLTLNTETMEVYREKRRIELTSTNLRLLEVLMRKAPHVVKHAELERSLWGDNPPDSSSLRTHIHYLRDALDKPFDGAMLNTVHGIGYRLSPLSNPAPDTRPIKTSRNSSTA